VTPTGNQSETGKTNTSLNHNGKRWKQVGSKTAFREGGQEGRISELTEAKVTGSLHNASNLSVLIWKLPTGEPCAGEPHARFGGRGESRDLSTPIVPWMASLNTTASHIWTPCLLQDKFSQFSTLESRYNDNMYIIEKQ
jgi:hypothetical protein